MASSNRIPATVDARSAELLERAYALDNDADTRRLYRDWADTYDDTMLAGLGYLAPRLVSELLATATSDLAGRVLDVGAGTGLAGQELHTRGFTHLDAFDYSAEMLAVAGARDVYEHLIEGDLTQPLDMPDETYSAAICTGTFTHGHVGPACLDELFRVIRRGGLFAFSIHKGVWIDAGFDSELGRLQDGSAIRLVTRESGRLFETSSDEDCWLNLYERR